MVKYIYVSYFVYDSLNVVSNKITVKVVTD